MAANPARYTTPAVTFGKGVGEFPYEAVALEYNVRDVKNDIQISNSRISVSGTGFNAAVTLATEKFALTDATSKGANGLLTKSITTVYNLASRLTNISARLAFELAQRKDNALRIKSITVNPARNPTTLWPLAMAYFYQLQRVTVHHISGGDNISKDLSIVGIHFKLSADPKLVTWTLDLDPAGLK